jgi:hypothetical protein
LGAPPKIDHLGRICGVDRSRVRVALVVVPALLAGALLGEWWGGRLFPVPGSMVDVPAVAGPQVPIEVRAGLPTVPAQSPTASATAVPTPDASATVSPRPGVSQPGARTSAAPPATATTTAAPPPVWGAQLSTSIQVMAGNGSGASVQVGLAQGWFQMRNDRTGFRYSFTFCRQSSYMLPYMAVSVNGRYVGQTWQSTPITTVNPSYSGQGCTAAVSNEHAYQPIQNVYLRLHGSTFNGQTHVESTQDRTFYNPN